MKTYFILSIFMLFFSVNLWSQLPCTTEPKFETLHGNDIRTTIGNIGNNLTDFSSNNGGFEVPFGSGSSFNDFFFLQSLWLGGQDVGGNLKVATGGYGLYSNQVDYWPGPLDLDIGTTTIGDCNNWNKLWSVKRHEIEAHINDFEDDGIISNILPSIYGWPGVGNAYFQFFNGFTLPANDTGFAPFFDRDQNGIYNPSAGDYPLPDNVESIPEQIIWSVFNDEGAGAIHGESNGLAIRAEIHQTVWVYNCSNNPVLNQTMFKSYKVINRGQEDVTDVYLGLFIDLDIGCIADDGFGSNADLNTAFSYNLDNEDGDGMTCPNLNPPGQSLPVFSTTILNKELEYLMPISEINGCTSFPDWALDYYLKLTGRISLDQPLTFGENGCNPDNPSTNLIFPGDPNNPNEWSLLTAGIDNLNYDKRYLASVKLNDLSPGELDIVEIAYSYHNKSGNTNLENVTLMYEDVVQIQDIYDNHFFNDCSPPFCEDDCVWPGDANRDEIADYKDLLAIALAQGKTGNERQNSLTWAPHDGQSWNGPIPNGPNLKHADCNGSGSVEDEDFEITISNYNKITPAYSYPQDVYQEGPEIYISGPGGSTTFNDTDPGDWIFAKVNLQEVPDLYGVAFQTEFDKRYISSTVAGGSGSQGSEMMSFNSEEVTEGNLVSKDHVYVMNDLNATILSGKLFNLLINVQPDFDEPLPSNQTEIRIKNITAIKSDGSLLDIGATTTTLTINGITTPTIQDENELQVNIYPNPADELVYITVENEELKEITLFDVIGRELINEEANGGQHLLDVNQMSSGLYWLKIKYNGNYFIEKLIVQ